MAGRGGGTKGRRQHEPRTRGSSLSWQYDLADCAIATSSSVSSLLEVRGSSQSKATVDAWRRPARDLLPDRARSIHCRSLVRDMEEYIGTEMQIPELPLQTVQGPKPTNASMVAGLSFRRLRLRKSWSCSRQCLEINPKRCVPYLVAHDCQPHFPHHLQLDMALRPTKPSCLISKKGRRC